MEYIHAALLLHKAGKDIKENSLKKVLEAAGVKVEDGKLKALVSALKDVKIEEAISTPVAVAAAPAGAAPQGGEAKPAEEKVEEEDEGKKDEDAGAGLAALFG
ncbi:MAG: 50S ribosomal protein P1 [Candidatus Altiarchaeota archaeon]|nr:50S ribosomal protein P1 [Candidatus Altiarchaeota archaeon]